MAQGGKKLNSKGFGLRKEKHKPKKQQVKKGARTIAPKKKSLQQQAQLKKGLDKAIKLNIEQEITMKVKSVEGKQFNVVSAQSSSSSSSSSKPAADTVKSKKK